MLLLLLHIRALVPHTTLHPSTIARALYRPFFVNLQNPILTLRLLTS